MRRIDTSKGKTYEVDYAWAPLYDGTCGIGLRDNRPLSQIAEEFDGLTHIHYSDPKTGEDNFDGYNELVLIERTGDNVQMKLAKGAD